MWRRSLRRKTKELLLGDSLSSNLYAENAEDPLIVSWRDTPSSLEGWDIDNTCIDRVPIYVMKRECVDNLGFKAREIQYDYLLVGNEETLNDKVYPPHAELTGTFWYDALPTKYSTLYQPESGWCSVIKLLRSRSRAARIYAGITEIDPLRKKVRIEGGSLLDYEKLINTLPQDLLLSRLKGVPVKKILSSYMYVPYNISVLIGVTEQRLNSNETLVYALGKRRFAASHVVLSKPPLAGLNSNHSLIYILTPLQGSTPKSEILARSISELRSLGLRVKNLLFIRSHIEKYGVLSGKTEDSRRLLRELDIEVRGRYGSWSELSVCDIIEGGVQH